MLSVMLIPRRQKTGCRKLMFLILFIRERLFNFTMINSGNGSSIFFVSKVVKGALLYRASHACIENSDVSQERRVSDPWI